MRWTFENGEKGTLAIELPLALLGIVTVTCLTVGLWVQEVHCGGLRRALAYLFCVSVVLVSIDWFRILFERVIVTLPLGVDSKPCSVPPPGVGYFVWEVWCSFFVAWAFWLATGRLRGMEFADLLNPPPAIAAAMILQPAAVLVGWLLFHVARLVEKDRWYTVSEMRVEDDGWYASPDRRAYTSYPALCWQFPVERPLKIITTHIPVLISVIIWFVYCIGVRGRSLDGVLTSAAYACLWGHFMVYYAKNPSWGYAGSWGFWPNTLAFYATKDAGANRQIDIEGNGASCS